MGKEPLLGLGSTGTSFTHHVLVLPLEEAELVQSSSDEGQEQQAPHRATHYKRNRIVHFIWLHFGFCLWQREEGYIREDDKLQISGDSPVRPCIPLALTEPND